jgi:hypothetical protein
LVLYSGAWVYFLDRANDLIQKEGSVDYNKDIRKSEYSVAGLGLGLEGLEVNKYAVVKENWEEEERKKLNSNKTKFADYGTTSKDLNPKDSRGNPILKTLDNRSYLTNSNDVLL